MALDMMAIVVEGGKVRYLTVDGTNGEIEELALVRPVGDFDVARAVALGFNLQQSLGLNGWAVTGGEVKGSAVKASTKRQPAPPQHRPALFDEPAALPAAGTPEVTHSPQKGRPGRKPGQPSKVDPANRAERFIPMEEVLEVIAGFPEGCTTRQIAQVISKQEDPPKWVVVSVANRLAIASAKHQSGKGPLPYRVEYRPKIGKDGNPTSIEEKLVFPL